MTVPERWRSPELAGLWRAVHARLCAGRPVARVAVDLPTGGEKDAVADLLGRATLPPDRFGVDLARLDTACLEAAGVDARAVVAEIVGPVGDAASDRAADRAAKQELRDRVRTHPVVRRHPALETWAAQVRFSHRSAAATAALWEDALRVLAALPADGRPLPEFAQHVVGHTKALNEDTALSSLVLRGLAAIDGVDAPAAAAARHRLWERWGVHSDQLSVTVLAAGLRPRGDGLVATLLRTCADAGHAASLTLAQLRTADALDVAADAVFTVENPAIVALALDRFGARCPPLVCTAGWPNGAVTLLLRHLAESSALRHHGDLDGEGVRITAHLAASVGARPWRMSADDYRAAVTPTGPPAGDVTDAPWDAALAPALREHGVAVSEEQVAVTLLDDLGKVGS